MGEAREAKVEPFLDEQDGRGVCVDLGVGFDLNLGGGMVPVLMDLPAGNGQVWIAPDRVESQARSRCDEPDVIERQARSRGAVPGLVVPQAQSRGAVPDLLVPQAQSRSAVPDLIVPQAQSRGAVPDLIVPRIQSRIDVSDRVAARLKSWSDMPDRGAKPMMPSASSRRTDLSDKGAKPELDQRTGSGLEAVWYGKKPYALAPMGSMENLRGVGLVCRNKAQRTKKALRSKIWDRLGKSLVWSLLGWCLAVGVLWGLNEQYRITVPMVEDAEASVVGVLPAPKPLQVSPFAMIQSVVNMPPIPSWGRYEVLVGSFVDPMLARRLHRQLLGIGTVDYWRSGIEDGRPRIQVLVGPFAKIDEANQMAKDLRGRLDVEPRVLTLHLAHASATSGTLQTLHPPK